MDRQITAEPFSNFGDKTPADWALKEQIQRNLSVANDELASRNRQLIGENRELERVNGVLRKIIDIRGQLLDQEREVAAINVKLTDLILGKDRLDKQLEKLEGEE